MTQPKNDVRVEIEKILDALAQPFNPEIVKWRPGSTTKNKDRCMALAYVDARIVMDRLDLVVGSEAWQDRLTRVGDSYICDLSLWLPTSDAATSWHWVTKSDSADTTNIEAAKGGASDAFKRAAVKWGVGRYLYALDSPWVDYDAQRKRITDAGMAQLRKVLGGTGSTTQQTSTQTGDPEKGTTAARKIDASGKKQLFRANFKALEYLGYSKEQIEALDSKEKYRPLNHAEGKIGVHRTDELWEHQIEDALAAMRVWTSSAKSALEQMGGALPDNPSALENF